MDCNSPTTITRLSDPSRLSAAEQRGWAIRWVFPSTSGLWGPLKPPITVLGRSEDCQLRLTGDEVSRKHAEVRFDGPRIVLRDLGSSNGVFLNGIRLQGEAALSPGDVVKLGQWVGVVDLVEQRTLEEQDWFADAGLGIFVGPVTKATFEQVRQAAVMKLPVLVEGETGTGKECVARALHAWSGRSGPMRAVNCAALPEGLAEAELFGYRKGAFTGADRASLGHFRGAEGGTLLLDEIVDLPLVLQAKLLRVLEQKEILPLGEQVPVPVDVRIVAASQEPLVGAARSKRFRADLCARLEGVTIQLPPLRMRVVEIPYLFVRLLHKYASPSPPAVDARLIERLCLYDWPFNVRELDLLVQRLVAVHGRAAMLRREHLPPRYLEETPKPGAEEEQALDEEERNDRDLAKLLLALRTHRGNVARASNDAGISRQRAYRLMAAQGFDLDALRQPSAPPPKPNPRKKPD
ncbi:MAG: sigma 54-interacting transcriptional regulator [Myxococcales bacterium]